MLGKRWVSTHAAKLAVEVRRRTEALMHDVLIPLNNRLMGPLDRNEAAPTVPLPFVLLLGNHSSGKSSFINHVLERQVQHAGVAPTDDSFTVIAPGAADADRDGPSFVGDPDLGFSPLRHYGPGLLNHIQLKVRAGLATEGLMIVDSPGMIDSPAATGHNPVPLHRGYDFHGVVRWLAEHADVILLFFDPDKPGTTGETLECLTTALAGVNHKLHIILNKVDRFEQVRRPPQPAGDRVGEGFLTARRPFRPRPWQLHDFARAYGSLCWNLAKVVPRKVRGTGCRPAAAATVPSALTDPVNVVLPPRTSREYTPCSCPDPGPGPEAGPVLPTR